MVGSRLKLAKEKGKLSKICSKAPERLPIIIYMSTSPLIILRTLSINILEELVASVRAVKRGENGSQQQFVATMCYSCSRKLTDADGTTSWNPNGVINPDIRQLFWRHTGTL